MGWRPTGWRRSSGKRPDAAKREQALVATGHRHDIQGLRAVAVLLVVLDHAGVPFMRGGYVGVDVFFVLSGFLITGLLLSGAAKHGYVSLVDFYARRAKRILPAATLTLVVTMIASYYLLNFVRAKQVVVDSIWASLFLANVRFAEQGTDYFAQTQPPSPIQHYWTLSVEEQFYFVWPALLALTLFGAALGRRSGAARLGRRAPVLGHWAIRRLLVVVVVGAAASLAWSIQQTGIEPVAAYFSTFTRAWELALGAGLAIGAAHVARIPGAVRAVAGWVGLSAIALAGVLFSATTAFPGYAALLPTVGTALVIAAGIGATRRWYDVGCPLSTAPLRYVGDRSYAYYLWHWPVLVIAAQYAGRELSVGVNLLLLVAAFALSIVSYKFFENPIRRAKWRVPASAALVPASVAAVAAVAVFAVVSLNSKFEVIDTATAAQPPAYVATQATPTAARSKTLPEVIAAVKAARRGAKIPSGLVPPVSSLLDDKNIYHFPEGCVPVADNDTSSEICRLGDPTGLKSIVVVGDSHAQMMMPTILAMAERDGWVVIPLVKSGCNPSAWIEKGYPGTPAATVRQCHAWYSWAVRKAKSLRPDVTLITGCCGAADDGSKKAFLSLAASMRRASKSVVLLADNAGVDREPVDCLLSRNATMRTCTTVWPPLRFEFNDELARLAPARGFGFLQTKGWFCFERACPMVVGRNVVYRDINHITVPYALKLVPQFRTEFRRCVLDACAR